MDKLMAFVGKVLFALPFIGFGIENIAGGSAKAGTVPAYIPGGVFWVYFTGVAMILAALAILTGKQAREACLGLAVMLLVFIVTVHLPHLASPELKVQGITGFYKDTCMMGGALVLATTFRSSK